MSEIKLNVGGICYSTTLQTMQKYDGSMLNRMFDDVWIENVSVQNKPIFIDRDENLFRYILNFLRDGENAFLPGDEETLRSLLNEAHYFLLDGLVHLINGRLNEMNASPNLQVGSFVRFKKTAVEAYYKSLARSLTTDSKWHRENVCGFCWCSDFDPRSDAKYYYVSCFHCDKRKLCESWSLQSDNESAVRNFLHTTKFEVEKLYNECCVVIPMHIHVPIIDLELGNC